ncbi:MAG: GFA family protein [Oricola sp.]|nr:GFA family protein [Oricola sp.]
MAKLVGKCLCGAVEFSFSAERIDHPSVCHCGQCRRWSGHQWASLNVPKADFAFIRGEDKVAWFDSSDVARRGFCSACGTSLFWDGHGIELGKGKLSVALGALEPPTGLRLEEHIFVADKGDYYDIADGLPQRRR